MATNLNKLITLGNLSKFKEKLLGILYTKDQVDTELAKKVNAEEGKGLSTNDYVKATVDSQINTAKTEAIAEAEKKVNAAKTELDEAKADKTALTEVKSVVDVLNGEVTVEGSVKKQVSDAKTELKNEIKAVDTKLQGAIDGLQWKDSVATKDELATAYPDPKEGWTVSVEDTNEIFRYDAESKKWLSIAKTLDLSEIEVATSSKNGLMSKEHVASLTAVVAESAQNKTDLATANGKITANENAIATLNGGDGVSGSVAKKVKDLETKLTPMITSKAEAETVTALSGKVDTNTAAIATLNGEVSVQGSVAAKVKVVDDKVVALTNTVAGKAEKVHKHVMADITDLAVASEEEILAIFA